ncbi:hypothetical protein RBB50_000737 [Rhinocladiella similis]
MAATKTFILAPNFTFHPDTSICMGDILQDPSDPTKPLSSSPRAELETTTHTDYDAELGKSASTSVGGGIWETFLQFASIKLYGEASKDIATRYTIDRLETVYFKKQPTDEQASRWALEPRVAAAINAGVVRRNPVYLVSGLKIARGFSLADGVSSSRKAGVGAEAPVTFGVGAGADVDVGRSRSERQSWRSEEDIVFAYQLHVIAQKGWREKTRRTDVRTYKSKAAFLSEEHTRTVDAVEMSVGGIPLEDVRDVFGADGRVRSVLEVKDAEEDVVQCVVLEDGHDEDDDDDDDDDDKE